MRVIGWLLFIAFLLFTCVTAALLVRPTANTWLAALIVGGVGTLVLPLVIELGLELRRKRRGTTSPLTRFDRLLLRIFVIDLVIAVAMWGFGSTTIREEFDRTTIADIVEDDHDGEAPVASSNPSTDEAKPDDANPVPSSNGPPSEGSTPTSEAPTDPQCIDGGYREALPDRSKSIDDLIDAYSEGELDAFVDGVLDRRYPIGATLVRGGRKQIDCVSSFLHNRSAAGPVLAGLSTVTHECGHMHDLMSGPTYHIAPDVQLSCKKGRIPHTFARSRLLRDRFAESRAPCAKGGIGHGCDSYANTYLTGDSGNQGFDMLIEELVQYIHGLATAYAFAPERYRGVRGVKSSNRDGVLTFLWYLERYLALARREEPKVHAALMADACWRRTVLTVWGRAWLYLEATRDDARMGIDADAIEHLVRKPELLAEIAHVRTAEKCAP